MYCLYQLFLPVVICAISYGFSNIFAGTPHEISLYSHILLHLTQEAEIENNCRQGG